ncbi:M48 family metallopeptidase [Aureivirga sp. CE67]|uniref:M48 family metallopeptidase n=1 Tax=Aureivirga sp. CE67 TaxID=1788983 RepID=UPI0018CA9E30|nr:M48 family metallopeptidase [Aureivirga sp. CE67]
MDPKIVFYIIIGIIILNFLFDKIIGYLNGTKYDAPIPELLKDVYDEEEYKKSQAYKKENSKFSNISGLVSIAVTLAFFFLGGFPWVDGIARSFSSNEIVITLIFMGVISLGSSIVSLPFSYYHTFVIEEKFGFNKTTKKLFWLDLIKGLFLGMILGGGILTLITWFYEEVGQNFWIYAWILVSIVSVFMNMFYSKLIVPLFNKQTPLEDGELKDEITAFAKKVGFTIDKIFVIDGSKRSTKANAYFSGFGREKRIVLYDTLINDLETKEIVAVLAHEVGHYKRKHIIFNLILSILLTGFTLFILSLLVNKPIFSEALGVSIPSFHVGLVAFAILYSPISEITGIIMNVISRKFEYQADDYAKDHYEGKYLISSLKKLSKNSLSNLTPHKAMVFVHYSHPPLLARVQNLLKK